MQANAYLAREGSTTPEDLLLLTHALWREPKEYSKVAHIVGQLADPVSAKAAEVLDAARETAARVAALRGSDRKSYLSQAAQALEDFKPQQDKLKELGGAAGPRVKQALGDADQEVGQLHYDLARALSAGLGLGGSR